MRFFLSIYENNSNYYSNNDVVIINIFLKEARIWLE